MQLPAIAGFCGFALALGVGDASTRGTAAGLFEVAFYLTIATLAVAGPGGAALYATEDGIRIRNAFSSTAIPWERVCGFRLGSHKLLSEVCLVDLADGSSRYVFGIQIPNATRGRSEMRMIDELNEILARHPHA
jgi:hypothetical protein